MPLKNSCSIHARRSKSSLKHSIRCFCGIFPSLKHNFIAYRSSKVSSRPDCIFEIHHLWQSGFSRVYSNWCCSCSFEPEIIKTGQSSNKMYSTKILNCQESTTIYNGCTKKVWKLIEGTTYICIKGIWHKITYNSWYAIKHNQQINQPSILTMTRMCLCVCVFSCLSLAQIMGSYNTSTVPC